MRSLSIVGGCLLFLLIAPVLAQDKGAEKADMGGWDLDGAYNRLYKNSERDRFKGEIQAITEVVPMPGMSPGVALIVKDADGEDITVHLGPKWFIRSERMGLRVGDRVKVKGVWAEIGEQDFFMAAKVKTGEFEAFKVRLTKNGMPFWAMSPEELARERSGK